MSASARRPAPPMPSSRQNPSSAFAWERAPAAGAAERRLEVARGELTSRAGLLYRLGYSEADAAARLARRVAWELDPGRRPDGLSDAAIAKLVAETYARKPG